MTNLRGPGAPVATLDTVARAAGVSRATVSRVVNGSAPVSAQVRDAVEEAIRSQGYSPTRVPRPAAERRTGSVALVVNEPEIRLFSDPMLAALTRAVGQVLAATDLQLVVMMVPQGRSGADRLVRFLRGGTVDGAILMSLHGDDPLLAALSATRMPCVLLGRPLGAIRVPHVESDSVGGARLATGHLLTAGRRRVATIAGPPDMCAGVDRLRGYRQAIGSPGLVVHGDFSLPSGQAAMADLLHRAPDVDGVFAANDVMAAGALRALRLAGRRVPDDVAVVGYDDLEVAAGTDPPLTTVHQDVGALARALVASLVALLHGEPVQEAVLLPNHLVVRESA